MQNDSYIYANPKFIKDWTREDWEVWISINEPVIKKLGIGNFIPYYYDPLEYNP